MLDRLFEQRLSQAKRELSKDGGGLGSIDVLLATNMISVGVDIPRLGTMVVAGQPKSTSEYIQATSRVGRQHPGMVIAVYNWARPRDLSHYETFCHYHRTLYRQVEALSVTPFAARALDRGLTGVLASLLRLSGPAWNANPGAGLVDPAAEPAAGAREAIRKRAEQVDHDAAESLGERVGVLLEAWVSSGSSTNRADAVGVHQLAGAQLADVAAVPHPLSPGSCGGAERSGASQSSAGAVIPSGRSFSGTAVSTLRIEVGTVQRDHPSIPGSWSSETSLPLRPRRW